MRRRGDVTAIDGEVGNSTHLEEVLKDTPDRYFEAYIAEQMMIATAVGFQVRGWTPFAATFAAFLSRAYDFVRMGVISQAKLCINGSHAGVSIGEDGPSQMALEDLAEFRALGGSVVLYPSDPNQTAKLVAEMADFDGISYLRSTRSGFPTLYGPDEEFRIGGSRVVRESDEDQVTLIGAGVTLHEAIKAADMLAEEGVNARVIDLYSVKPVDVETLAAASSATGGRLIVAEDHWPEGGIGDAVSELVRRQRRAPPGGQARRQPPARVGQDGRAAGRCGNRRRPHRHRGAAAGRAGPADRSQGHQRRLVVRPEELVPVRARWRRPASGVTPQSAKHGVRVAMVGAYPDPDEIKLLGCHRADGSAVLCVASGREHLHRVDGQRHPATCRSVSRSSQVARGGLEDEQRLDEQGQVRDAVGVLIRLTDRLGLCCSDEAADEECGDVQALPRRQVITHDHRRLGGKIADSHPRVIPDVRATSMKSG